MSLPMLVRLVGWGKALQDHFKTEKWQQQPIDFTNHDTISAEVDQDAMPSMVFVDTYGLNNFLNDKEVRTKILAQFIELIEGHEKLHSSNNDFQHSCISVNEDSYRYYITHNDVIRTRSALEV